MRIYSPIFLRSNEKMNMNVIIVVNLFLFGVTCGLLVEHHPSRRIVDGSSANEGDFKYQVSIRVRRKHRCSGSIISSNGILTAASCFLGARKADLSILAGTLDLHGSGNIYYVEDVIYPKSFKKGSLANDIAVIKTTEEMTTSDKIDGIMLNFEPLPNRADMNISGWGATYHMSSGSQKLQYTTVRLAHNNECVNKLKYLISYLDKSNFCTIGDDGGSSCFKDTGGPVVYQNQLVGVIIKSYLCKGPNIHTRVSSFMEWINDALYYT